MKQLSEIEKLTAADLDRIGADETIPVPALQLRLPRRRSAAWGIAAGVFFLAMLIWQHVIISPKDLSRLNAAFFTANGIASIVFCVLVYLSVLL